MFNRKDAIFLITAAFIMASIAYTPFVIIHQHEIQTGTLNQLINQTTESAVIERDVLQNTVLSLFAAINHDKGIKIIGNETHFNIYDHNGTLISTIRDISTNNHVENLSNYIPF